jgi:Arc/MetJ-type ribon-helix-helix transcriptional regulator
MSIEITPEVENLVQGIFATGHFASEAEVLTVAVRLLHDRQQLRSDLEQGRRELDSGERIAADSVFAELRTRASELDGPAP